MVENYVSDAMELSPAVAGELSTVSSAEHCRHANNAHCNHLVVHQNVCSARAVVPKHFRQRAKSNI